MQEWEKRASIAAIGKRLSTVSYRRSAFALARNPLQSCTGQVPITPLEEDPLVVGTQYALRDTCSVAVVPRPQFVVQCSNRQRLYIVEVRLNMAVGCIVREVV